MPKSGRKGTLATIGYEHRTLAEFIERLESAGIEIVLDIRAVSSSRRAGFSKTLLAGSLAEHGIEYLHLRQLGTPKPGRQAAHAGRIEEMHRIYEAHLAEPGAQVELARATEIAGEKRAALLCYEAQAERCHRAIVADRIRDAIGCTVENL